MTPQEILQQTDDQINSRIPKVTYSNVEHGEIVGFGLTPTKGEGSENAQIDSNHKAYERFNISTKMYLDQGSAVYKLIRLLESATNGVVEIYWRFTPTVFHFKEKRYIGRARFTVLRGRPCLVKGEDHV